MADQHRAQLGPLTVDAKWVALAREAGLAAEHMAIGVTALGRASYAHPAYYSQAFFALSVGFERAAKLAIVTDHAIRHKGVFPDNETVRKFGHNLRVQLERVDQIAAERKVEYRLPHGPVTDSIISVLSDFSTNLTRYYNLDAITESARIKGKADPVSDWYDRVMTPVLELHYRPARREADVRKAKFMAELIGGFTFVSHTSERGEGLSNVADASMQTALVRAAAPWVRMYVMQIARFLGTLLSDLGNAGTRHGMPYFSEFFGTFNNDDKYFRSRKSWSIYV